MRSAKILLACMVAISVFSTLAYAEVPRMINYQGKITTPQGALISDTFSMVFSIYADSTGGIPLWTETQPSVKVEFGVFSVLLGSINPIPATVFDGNTRYLGLKVGIDNEMTPRKAIVSVGYAYHSGTADTAHFAMPDADWTIEGDTIYHLNGNVGIGTTTPQSKLDVAGSIRPGKGLISPHESHDAMVISSVRDIYGDASDNRNLWINANAGTNAVYMGVNSNTMLYVSGNVGIGTTSPTQKLHINSGNIQMTWGDYSYSLMGGLRFGTSYNNWDDWAGIEGWTYGGLDQSYLRFYTTFGSRSEKMCIMPSGNVGIGTTNPEFKLDVAGDIRSTGTIYGNFSGTINNALLWNGHNWGDTYPYSSNSDMVDGIHGTQFLRNDQSGTLSGSVGDYQAVLNVLNSGEGRSIYASTNASMNRNAAIYGDALDDGGVGVYGHTSSPGVSSGSSVGVFGLADNSGGSVGGAAMGVFGRVYSYQNSPNSVPVGVFGEAMSGTGNCWGVAGETWSTSPGAAGVKGTLKASGAQGRAIWGEAPTTGWAGYFQGNVNITGSLTKGGGSFKIDHPLDPANKYLSHSFVESPDMMNIYNGNVILDSSGDAWIELPEWFEALNRDFRYQLSAIGQPGPDLYIAQEISGNRFKIAGGKNAMKVSWQVTGIRKDAYAEKHRIQVEEEKPPHERGKYLHPKELGMPETMGIGYQEMQKTE
jgi:hypothetical protein